MNAKYFLQVANAQRVLRTRPATSAVNPVTSPATAKTHPKKVLDVVASAVAVVVQPKSATRYFCSQNYVHAESNSFAIVLKDGSHCT